MLIIKVSRRPTARNKGFTLAEIAIVIVIVGLLLTFVLKGQSFMDSAKSTDVVTTAKDLSAAVSEFKSRYHFLPGDLPAASADLSAIAAGSACDVPNTVATIGNGAIDTAAEIACVSQHLLAAGLVSKAAPDGSFNGAYGRVWVMSRESALNTSVTRCRDAAGTAIALLGAVTLMKPTIAVFERVPSDVARKIDTEFDDGNATTGTIRGSVAYAPGLTIACFGMPVY